MNKMILPSLIVMFISFNAFGQFTPMEFKVKPSDRISKFEPGGYSYMNPKVDAMKGYANFSCDTMRPYFIIEKPFGHTTYEGVRIRNIKTADIKKILYPNSRAYKKYSSAAALNVLGSLMLIGGGVATFINTSAASSGEAVDPQAQTIVMALSISAIPLLFSAKGMKKKAIRIYNED